MAAPFEFRFESVLLLRKVEEEKVKRELAPFAREYGRLAGTEERLKENLRLFNMGKLDFLSSPERLSLYVDGTRHFRQAIAHTTAERQRLEKEYEKARMKLKEALMRRKAIEIIREKDLAEWKREMRKKEQIELEETAVMIGMAKAR